SAPDAKQAVTSPEFMLYSYLSDQDCYLAVTGLRSDVIEREFQDEVSKLLAVAYAMEVQGHLRP
ncbi:MAG TPA: hypothetical protein VHQ86_05020, partial [Candidatus Saccharimonadia bacterium]|nr:hypothetical protein [Candidatus Saccharimonadia bacterium]